MISSAIRMNEKSAIGIMFRIPEHGRVKSRLAREIGDEMTLWVYRDMLETTLKRVSALSSIADIYGFFTGMTSDDSWGYKDIPLIPQTGNDLGERIFNVALRLFYGGTTCGGNMLKQPGRYNKVIIIGVDSPDLPLEYIKEAFLRLEHFSVVIGPCEDGGYYLIGMVEPLEVMFKDIPWGTPEVLNRTLSILRGYGVSFDLLPEWYDIDDLKTLKRWSSVSELVRSCQSTQLVECSDLMNNH